MIKSKSQQRLMYAAANNSKVRTKTKISKKIAKEYIKSTPKSRFKKLKEKLGCSKCSEY